MKFLLDMKDHATFKAMNQTGVKQYAAPGPAIHNACWDALMDEEGKVYVSLCSELTTGEYAKLALYDPNDNTLKEIHYSKEYLFSGDRMIRDSKYADNKELMIIPGAVHTDLYDGGDNNYIPFDKIEEFLKKNL